ncbi:aminoglycoside phosphotransferase family protein [Microbulbifer elongatus]|uniref:aminoglycoside phosphotransferase family protein n=1 Tax=Microbulbifer elongatus TaxID=86173 RepID=UPI001CFCB9F7|nr:aminoglycoside phosphotransferase family protein [Microbulbifer elongatus]
MFLIMSGSYILQELNAEFGRIPPSFLPLGNRRLFRHQLNLVPKGEAAYISIPDDYSISDSDIKWLRDNKVSILRTDPALTLGEGLVSCLSLIDEPTHSSCRLLFGDTLLEKLPEGMDVIASAKTRDNYRWSKVNSAGIYWESGEFDANGVVCGYFCFSSPKTLLACLTKEKWDFISGVERYRKEVGLSEVEAKGWYDFGHINTYYQSKASFTTQRSFNELKITRSFIEKSSENVGKIKAEGNWFSSLPASMRLYTPLYLGGSECGSASYSYSLEYLYNISLSELFVFSEVPPFVWDRILDRCFEFLNDCLIYKSPPHSVSQDINDLLFLKTRERVARFCSLKDLDPDKKWNFNGSVKSSINELMLASQQKIVLPDRSPTLMHGDFCFSNILYDFRTDRIKVIDPRGMTLSGETTIYGDVRYDIAKLSHSILGMYDYIVAGYHTTHIDWNAGEIEFEINGREIQESIQNNFCNMVEKFYGLSRECLFAMQIQLFLSMLPLHSDDPTRQAGLFANAFRLFGLLGRGEE